MKLQTEYDTLAKECGLKIFTSKMIFNDVSLYGLTAVQHLAYLRTIQYLLKDLWATLKVKRFKWFQYRCKFTGSNVEAGVTQPT